MNESLLIYDYISVLSKMADPTSNDKVEHDSAHNEQRVQELVHLLQVEKARNHELSVKVTQQHSTIEELRRELQQRQQRIDAHIQTVNILVGEKTDLTAKLQQRDQRINELETIQEENNSSKRLHQETFDENIEIQHQLPSKTTKFDEFDNVISSKNSELEIDCVCREALTGGDLTHAEISDSDQNCKIFCFKYFK